MESPKVTIGIPVYNEESCISGTLDSLLKQDYNNFEILISDNNSTDNTISILRNYEKEHQKIKVLFSNTNRGAIENWNNLISNAEGEYFMICGSHDLISSDYISCLMYSLDNNPRSVLAYGKTVWIDEEGKELPITSGFVDTSNFNLINRFNLAFFCNQHALYGLFRLSILKKTRLQLQVVASGALLLSELSLFGEFAVNTDAIWYRRATRNIETRDQRLVRYYRNLFNKKKLRVFPFSSLFWQYLKVPFLNNQIAGFKRVLLFFNIFFVFILRYYYDLFLGDIKSVIARLFHLR